MNETNERKTVDGMNPGLRKPSQKFRLAGHAPGVSIKLRIPK